MKRLLAFLLLGLALAAAPALAQAQVFGNTDVYDASATPTTTLVSLAAAGAGTTTSTDLVNQYGHGVVVSINISAKTGTVDIVTKVQGKDPVSGQYYDVCVGTSRTTAAFFTLQVYPAATPSAGAICNAVLPLHWRVAVVSGTGISPVVTMTVSAQLVY